jgi:aminomethyltransferase
MVVKNAEGEVVGEVTSGTFSPSLKAGIALALVSEDIKVGDKLVIDVRGREGIIEVVKLPFVTSHVR